MEQLKSSNIYSSLDDTYVDFQNIRRDYNQPIHKSKFLKCIREDIRNKDINLIKKIIAIINLFLTAARYSNWNREI